MTCSYEIIAISLLCCSLDQSPINCVCRLFIQQFKVITKPFDINKKKAAFQDKKLAPIKLISWLYRNLRGGGTGPAGLVAAIPIIHGETDLRNKD